MSFYLVTGGAGFIGSNIVAELLQRGERVRVLDNFSTGKRENLAPFVEQIDVIEGDVRDPQVLQRAVMDVDYILHQAALPSVQESIDDPLLTHAVNITGTLNLLLAAREAGVKRLVLASSCAIYGDSPVLPKREAMLPAPKSPYAVSKLSGEQYCRTFTEVFDLETVCLRYFNVFGPRQDPDSEYAAVIPKFVTAMLQGDRPTIYGDGKQSRDFVYVGNVVRANLLAATAPEAAARVLNIAGGERYTLLDLVEVLRDILDADITPVHEAPRPGEVRHSEADITAAQNVLGYQAQISFREGLRHTIDWYSNYSDHTTWTQRNPE